MTKYQEYDYARWFVYTLGTIVPNFISIRFETTEPYVQYTPRRRRDETVLSRRVAV